MSGINNIDHIYCIHLEHRTDREDMIKETCKNHNINITFINAIEPEDKIVSDKLNIKYNTNNSKDKITDCMRKEYACVLSHLKAIQTVITNNDDLAIIIEDDAQFISNFKYMIQELLSIWKRDEYPIVHLSPFISNYDGMDETSFQDCDCEDCMDNLNRLEFLTTNNDTWSAAGYLVAREGAEKVIDTMDHRFKYIKYITSETVILQQKETCLCLPPLIVESCKTPSSIQPAASNEYHIKYWNNYRKYHKYL